MKSYRSVALLICSLLISFFACEGVLASLHFPRGLLRRNFSPFWLNQHGLGVSMQQVLQDVDDPENALSAYEYDIDHTVRLKNNIDKLIQAFFIPYRDIEEKLPPWRIVTNGHHHRTWSDNRSVESPTFLFVMGGSSPFGWGVDFEQSFPALIAQTAGRPIRVINLAVPGYTIYDAVLLYHQHRETIQKSGSFYLILDGGSNNSGLADLSDRDAHAYRLSWNGKVRLFFSRSRLYWLGKRFLNQYSYFHQEFDTMRISYSEYREYSKELLNMAIEDGGKPLVLNICNDDETIIQIMKEYSLRLQIPFFDVNDFFNSISETFFVDQPSELRTLAEYYKELYGPERIKEYPRWMVEFHKNCHPNKLGHRLVAKGITDLLKGLN